jgi:glycosyltransferase involved in cell wall biosynthesis
VISVLFASEYHPPFAPGGGEWSNAAWAAALARRGHRVTVVTLNLGALSREEQDGVTVIRIPFPVKLRPGQGQVRPWLHRSRLFYLYFAWRIWRAARAAGASVIHVQGKAALVPGWLAGWLARTPVVVTIRDLGLLCPLGMCTLFDPGKRYDCSTGQYLRRCVPYFMDHYEAGAPRGRRLRLRISLALAWVDLKLRGVALRRVRAVIGVSRGILDLYPLRVVGGGRARVVHTLPPRMEPSRDESVERVRGGPGVGAAPMVLYAGKVSPGKGIHVLLEAADTIRAAVPGARIVVAGKGSLPGPGRPGVEVLGALPQPDLFTLYRAADVVVVPSIWAEPLSRVLLEAMSFGRPVVATTVGGTPEAVEHGVTGLLVPSRDAEALAKAVIELLLDPDRRARMGTAARRRASEVFDETRLVAELEAVYAWAAGATP